LGLEHVTEMVVDEISVAPLGREDDETIPSPPESQRTAFLYGSCITDESARTVESAGYDIVWIRNDDELRNVLNRFRADDSKQVSVAVVETIESMDKILRPWPDRQQGLLRPRGTILLADVAQPKTGLLAPILERGIKISTSRCGDFRRALPALQTLLEQGIDLGAMVTDTLSIRELPHAFERARSPGSIKVVVVH